MTTRSSSPAACAPRSTRPRGRRADAYPDAYPPPCGEGRRRATARRRGGGPRCLATLEPNNKHPHPVRAEGGAADPPRKGEGKGTERNHCVGVWTAAPQNLPNDPSRRKP